MQFNFWAKFSILLNLFWCLRKPDRPHGVNFSLIMCHYSKTTQRDIYGVHLSRKTHNLNQFICAVFPVCVSVQSRDAIFTVSGFFHWNTTAKTVLRRRCKKENCDKHNSLRQALHRYIARGQTDKECLQLCSWKQIIICSLEFFQCDHVAMLTKIVSLRRKEFVK